MSGLERVQSAFATFETTFNPDFLIVFKNEIEGNEDLLNEANRRIKGIAQSLLDELDNTTSKKRRRIGDDPANEVAEPPFDRELARSIDVLTAQVNSKSFKDFYRVIKIKRREGEIIGDYMVALEAIVRENLSSLASLADGKHRLKFYADGKLTPDESYDVVRGIRGWANWAFSVTSMDQDISNLKEFADFVTQYFLNQTQTVVDQSLVDLLNRSITGMTAMKENQYKAESKRNEFIATQSAIDALTRTVAHVKRLALPSEIKDFLEQIAITINADESLKDEKNRISRLATRLQGCMSSIIESTSLPNLKTLLSSDKGLCKHKEMLVAAVILSANGKVEDVDTLCATLNGKRTKYLNISWIVDEDCEVRDIQLFKDNKLGAFCDLIQADQKKVEEITKQIEEEDPDFLYRIIQNIILASGGGIIGILACLLGNRMPKHILAGTPYAVKVAGSNFDAILDEVLKRNYFAQGHLPQAKLAISKFREEALQKNPQEALKKVMEFCQQQLTEVTGFYQEHEKLSELIKKLLEDVPKPVPPTNASTQPTPTEPTK